MASTARWLTHPTSLRYRTCGSRTFHLELLSRKQGSLRCCPRYISSCASVPQCRRMRPGWLKSRKMISWSSKTCPEGWNRSQSGHGPSRKFWRPALNPDKFRSESGRTPPRSGSGLPISEVLMTDSHRFGHQGRCCTLAPGIKR